MSEKLEALRNKLHGKLDSGIDKMEKIQNSISTDVAEAEGAVQAKLDKAKAAGASAKQKVADAKNNLKSLAEEKKLETEVEVAGWKAERELKKLEKRAERAENLRKIALKWHFATLPMPKKHLSKPLRLGWMSTRYFDPIKIGGRDWLSLTNSKRAVL